MTCEQNMSGSSQKGKGRAIAWLRQHMSFRGKECLTWPFYRLIPHGYGRLGYEGGLYYAHRYMCEQVHGPAPTSKHEAAHSCGRGHTGCVNPRHLSWKTRTANLLDRRTHGTHVSHRYGNQGKLSASQVARIQALKGKKTQFELAAMFKMSRGCIQYWHHPNQMLTVKET